MTELLTNVKKPAPCSKKPVKIEQVGRTRTDDYAWLKDENWREVMQEPGKLNPQIRKYLESENDYCQAVMAKTKKLQDVLFAEMKGRIKDDDGSVPAPDGRFEYAHRFRSGDQHGIYVRAPRGGGDEQVLLDADALALMYKQKGYGFFDIGNIAHSDNHKYLAFSFDIKGAEQFLLLVIDIESGLPVTRPLENTSGDFVWAGDDKTLFWVERDENNRPSKVWRKNIIENGKKELVYEEKDAGFFVGLDRSDSGNFVEIGCHDHTTSEAWLIPAKNPTKPPKCASKRVPDLEYDLHDHNDDFYILTNKDGAVDFKIMRTKTDKTTADNWQEFIAHKPGTLIIDIETYKNYLVRIERENALPRIIIRNLANNKETEISFDEQAYSLGLMGGYEFDTEILRFSYSSPTTPAQVFDYNMKTGKRILRKTLEIPSGHNPKNYKTERIMIKARDGIEIPVTLIMHKNFKKNAKAPCLLYGYGSYGITIPASFRTSLLSLLDRGFVYAIAHIRGGKAKGYQWYLDGKLQKKHKTFDDFVDVGLALAKMKYTNEGKIIAHGGSAGGLLVGAALNQAPNLFAGVIAAVPFVDVLNTMSDDSLPLTPPEWPEWGNPLKSKKDYDIIASYCPYTNIKDNNYPPVLITAGLTDPRVTYWEPAKWAAKLREHQKANAPILLKTNMEAGHQGESGRYDALKETAFDYAFAIAASNYKQT